MKDTSGRNAIEVAHDNKATASFNVLVTDFLQQDTNGNRSYQGAAEKLISASFPLQSFSSRNLSLLACSSMDEEFIKSSIEILQQRQITQNSSEVEDALQKASDSLAFLQASVNETFDSAEFPATVFVPIVKAQITAPQVKKTFAEKVEAAATTSEPKKFNQSENSTFESLVKVGNDTSR